MHTLAAPLWPPRFGPRAARAPIFSAPRFWRLRVSVFLAISAKFQIPFWPVPFTLQTFVVSILEWSTGANSPSPPFCVFGRRRGRVAGVRGRRRFGVFRRPHGGLFARVLPAAFLLGWLAERGWGRGFVATFAAMTMGAALVFAVGVSWLGYAIGFEKAVAVGLLPFVPSEAIKIVAAALLLPACWRRFGRGARGESESGKRIAARCRAFLSRPARRSFRTSDRSCATIPSSGDICPPRPLAACC